MDEGKIVNVSSVNGKLGHGSPSSIAYSSMKAAFDSYTKNLAKYLAPRIIVNAIAPGQTLTSMWGELSKEEEKDLGNKLTHPVLISLYLVIVVFVSGFVMGLGVVALSVRFQDVDSLIWLTAGTLGLLLLVAACRRALMSVIRRGNE